MNSLRLGLFTPFTSHSIHPAVLASFILALLVPPPVYAQMASLNTTPARQVIDVQGTVVNSITGEPLARTLVTLNSPIYRSMLTDGEGHFTFEAVPPSALYLQVRKPGFFARREQIIVPAGEAENVTLKLAPAGVIMGRVVDESGEPLEGAGVQLMEQHVMNGRRRWLRSRGASTNDDGKYRLPDLHPGKYIVVVQPSQRNIQRAKSGYAEVYFPKAPDRASATPIPVSAGEQVEANFDLSPVPLFTISGVVTGPKFLGASVMLNRDEGNGMVLSGGVDPNGHFEIRSIPRGRYYLTANGFVDPALPPLVARNSLSVNSDLSSVVMVLHQPISIPVLIRNETQNPGITYGQNPPMLANIQAIQVGDQEYMGGGGASFEGPAENKTLLLRLLNSGTYNIMIAPMVQGYISSARCGSTDLLTEPLVVPASGIADPIEIVVRNDAAKLSGTIRNSKTPAMVVAVPDRDTVQPPITFGTGPDGKLYAQQLAPGGYTLYAFTNLEDIEYGDREALKAFRSKSLHVTLSANQTTDVTLDAIEVEP